VGSEWDKLEQRFGAKLAPFLVEWFDEVNGPIPFQLWLPQSWSRLVDVARVEDAGSHSVPEDLVVIGEMTDSGKEYDHERGYMASQGVFYCLDRLKWSGEIVPLFRWVSGKAPHSATLARTDPPLLE